MSADMPKMPEPFGYWHEGETYEESEFFLASEFGNVGCDRCTGLYTAEDLEKAKQEAARQAMERCIAAIAACRPAEPNDVWEGAFQHVCDENIAAIRALADVAAQEVGK